jgi:hypothetical protein
MLQRRYEFVAEDNNQHNKPQQNKIINVTKPQQSSSSIDASRVSAYTLREQQSLEKLKKKIGNLDQKESKASSIKTVVAIVLVLILILIAVLFVLFIGKSTTSPEEDYDMRLSMQIENKSSLSIITEAGKEQLREINPGDKVALRASVRNSFDISGDLVQEGTNPPSIYVRFKLVLILDYKERYDIMIPTMSDRWHKYNAEVESSIPNGVFEDDHYYYYIGSLAFMEPEELFSGIEFDGNVITCEDGGKYGQIQVHVEAIEANIGNIASKSVWPTAPQEWVNKMVDMWTGNGD